MTTFARLAPLSTAAHPPAPVPPTPPPGGPVGPPPPPSAPPSGVSTSLVVDLTEASRLANRAVEMLAEIPVSDTGSDATKESRIRVYKTNMAAQSRIERQIDAAGNAVDVLSGLRRADAHLEDANWQLAKKPSPDGRFTGVDIPGAVRDTREGARLLDELLRAASGAPATPVTPPAPGVPPPSGPTLPPPSGPTLPPPTTTPPPTPPAVPGTGTPDGDYPGDDEFPRDDGTPAGSGDL